MKVYKILHGRRQKHPSRDTAKDHPRFLQGHWGLCRNFEVLIAISGILSETFQENEQSSQDHAKSLTTTFMRILKHLQQDL